MSDLVRCETCQGSKIMRVIGGMHRKCDPCLGIGWIAEKKIEIFKKEMSDNEIKPIERKKPGRKKKEV